MKAFLEFVESCCFLGVFFFFFYCFGKVVFMFFSLAHYAWLTTLP